MFHMLRLIIIIYYKVRSPTDCKIQRKSGENLGPIKKYDQANENFRTEVLEEVKTQNRHELASAMLLQTKKNSHFTVLPIGFTLHLYVVLV